MNAIPHQQGPAPGDTASGDSAPVDILIVGGGTAGWMTAATFARFLERGYRIRLIESEAIGTVGVGEATIPQIHLFNQALGLDEDAFVRATQGSFKLGIEFDGWQRPGSRYMHAFGAVGRDVGLVPFRHYWQRAQASGDAAPLGHYSLNEAAARAGRMQRGPARTAKALPETPYAFHFDAGLYAAYLRRFAEARGVERVEGRVVHVARDGETGNVASVTLDGDRTFAADFFVDCSGFRGLLIEEALGTGYEDWTHWLPCDRALAVPCASVADLTPYTRATARSAGWQWRIPLQHRTGNGIVYCSGAISDDAAADTLLANLDGAPLADPRPLRFRTGRRARLWNRNVVAIGLSSGFLEPLESTSIHLIQSGIARLMKLLPGRTVDPASADEYNRQGEVEYAAIRDFLILHYHANARDEDFWRQCAAMPIPESLSRRIALFAGQGHIVREAEELFTEEAWLQVFVGQGIVPAGRHPLANAVPAGDVASYLDTWGKLVAREVAQMPTHADFIAQHCAARDRQAA